MRWRRTRPPHSIANDDVLRRQPFRDAEIVLERLVHAGHNVADHLRRGVPDAQLLAERRVEGFEEGLVEVRHRIALVPGPWAASNSGPSLDCSLLDHSTHGRGRQGFQAVDEVHGRLRFGRVGVHGNERRGGWQLRKRAGSDGPGKTRNETVSPTTDRIRDRRCNVDMANCNVQLTYRPAPADELETPPPLEQMQGEPIPGYVCPRHFQ